MDVLDHRRGVTGVGLLGLGLFLACHRYRPDPAPAPWIASLRPFWGVPLGFGVVVLLNALDVARDRRTLLRLLEGGDRPAPRA